MPNCDFYATLDDHKIVLDWLFAEGTCQIFELYSEVEKPLKQFTTTDEVLNQFNNIYPTGEKWNTVYLQLYVLGASPPFEPRRIDLNPVACDGATFRYTTQGLGLVQLYLAISTPQGLKFSHTNHNSQKRAEKWADTIPEMQNPTMWDFKKITAFSSRLNRYIKKISVTNVHSHPILPNALKTWQSGVSLVPQHYNEMVILK